jgi:hypothetical protein
LHKWLGKYRFLARKLPRWRRHTFDWLSPGGLVAGSRSLAISLGLCALAAVPAAAQARATIVATATVVDLSEAQATMQATTGLATQAVAQPAGAAAPARRDTGIVSVVLSYPEGPLPGEPSDPLLATIIYW